MSNKKKFHKTLFDKLKQDIENNPKNYLWVPKPKSLPWVIELDHFLMGYAAVLIDRLFHGPCGVVPVVEQACADLGIKADHREILEFLGAES